MRFKAKQWEYENEWIIIKKGAGARSFPPNCLEVIIFGCRISEADRKKVIEAVNNSHLSPKFYQAVQSKEGFIIGKEKINVSDVLNTADTKKSAVDLVG